MVTTQFTTVRTVEPLSRVEKGRLTRQCHKIADMIWGCEEYMPALPIYQLAGAAAALRDIPTMLRAVQLWEEMPAKKRAKIEKDATHLRALRAELVRRRDAKKPPCVEEPSGDHHSPSYRFRALHLATFCGTPTHHPLRTVVYDALMAPTREAYGPALIAWDTRDPEEREEIITVAQRAVRFLGGTDDWWIHALNRVSPAEAIETETLTATETARLSKRFAHMNRAGSDEQ